MTHHDFGKVGVLAGGFAAERGSSLLSGQTVLAGLQRLGIDAHLFDPAIRPLCELAAQGFDRVFLALHGRFGEDGTLQGALEYLRIPYTGSGVLASALAMHKVHTKHTWRALKLPTPRHRALIATTDWELLVRDLGLPLVVKPAREGSGLGVSKVTDLREGAAAYERAAVFDEEVFAEEYVAGSEFACTVLGTGDTARALPFLRSEPDESDYRQRRISQGDLPASQMHRISDLVMKAYHGIGCRGWGRIDLIIDQNDRPHFIELNTSPGMTEHSVVPAAAKAAGITYDALVESILRDAALDRTDRPFGQK